MAAPQVSWVLGLSRPPCPQLRPFVRTVWATQAGPLPPSNAPSWRFERVLPTGLMHLVFRWSAQPLVVRYDAENNHPIELGHSLIGGARDTSYLRQLDPRSHSVGALLFAGTSTLLFGVRAGELAERHTNLDSLWSLTEVAELRERMEAAHDAEARVAVLERALLARLPRVHGLHPAVAEALVRLSRSEPVSAVVERTGYSHRALISLFRDAVGLSPKAFSRIARFQRAIERLNSDARPSLVEVATNAGYADQAHFTREFTRITRMRPSVYRRANPEQCNHVPVGISR
ncbi:MAG: helix-turn-helix domain-containing protein [Polyangiaceae bacterium]